MKAAEIKINLIKGRRYLIGKEKYVYDDYLLELHSFKADRASGGLISYSLPELLNLEVKLLPNVPDENTPIDTLVRVWDDDNQSKAAINRSTYLWFAGISRNKEYPFMVFRSNAKSTSAEGTMFFQHAEIVEVEDESES